MPIRKLPPAIKRGVLFDEKTGNAYLFFDLKLLCAALGIKYRPLQASIRRNRLYMGRFNVASYPVPHQTDFSRLTPLF